MANDDARPTPEPAEQHVAEPDPAKPAGPAAPTPPTPEEARAALDDLHADSANLAALVVTPWWYHLCLALIVALIIGAQGLPGAGGIVGTAIGVICIPLLTVIYARRYGVSTSRPAGPRSRALLLASALVLVAGLGAVLIIKFSGQPWFWMLVPALLAGILTLVLGRSYDNALRRELAAGSGRPV